MHAGKVSNFSAMLNSTKQIMQVTEEKNLCFFLLGRDEGPQKRAPPPCYGPDIYHLLRTRMGGTNTHNLCNEFVYILNRAFMVYFLSVVILQQEINWNTSGIFTCTILKLVGILRQPMRESCLCLRCVQQKSWGNKEVNLFERLFFLLLLFLFLKSNVL